MIGTLTFAALLAVADHCAAQTAADAVNDPPAVLRGVRFGQLLDDLQKLIPDTRLISDPKNPRSALFVVSGNLAPWDGAMLEFFENRLVAINLMLGVLRKTNIERVNTKLAEVLARHGEGYARQIVLAGKQPSRMFIWQTREAQVFAVGPPFDLRPAGGTFAVAATLRVGITTPDRTMDRIATLASEADLIELLFRVLQFQ